MSTPNPYDICWFAYSAQVHTPVDVWNGLSLKQQTPSSFVFKYYISLIYRSPTSSTISTIFFLCTWFGVAISPEIPSNCIRSPTWDPSGGRISAPFEWSGVEAHNSMPFDGYPANFLTFMLHITHTSWPIIDSAEWNARIPDPMLRGDASPTSTRSQINLKGRKEFRHTYHYPDDSMLLQLALLGYLIDLSTLQEWELLVIELAHPL